MSLMGVLQQTRKIPFTFNITIICYQIASIWFARLKKRDGIISNSEYINTYECGKEKSARVIKH